MLNYFKNNVINYLTRSLNKINEPKNLLISDSFVNWKILVEYTMSSKFLVTPKQRLNANLKLICFPYAGGGVATYSSWVEHLQNNIELSIV